MKKTLIAIALSSVSALAIADGWKFAPVLGDAGFKFQPTVAATAGSLKPHGDGSATAYGLEVNFNCGLLQSPDNRIRTHLSLARADDKDFDATLLELSPRYTLPLANGFSIGVGPSLGAVRMDPAGAARGEKTLFAYGVVAGLNYRMDALYGGLDVGVRRTNDKDGVDFDSRSATVKLGVNF